MKQITGQKPKTAKFNYPPMKKTNHEQRSREYLSVHEVESLRKAARSIGRNGLRDDTLVMLMFRHALRVSEVITLKWDQIDLKSAYLYVNRIKNGTASTHPLGSVELRALRQLKRRNPHSTYVFLSERQSPLSERTVHYIIARSGEKAKLGFPIHPHMLRHSTGFHLANQGRDTRTIQAYMGHANIKNTVIYTQVSPKRFNDFWKD